MKKAAPKWIYYKRLFHSRFQASCIKAKIEDNWTNGYEIGPLVEIRKLKTNKYVVRYTYDE
ncbi:hypothetical protein [Alkalihalobacillus trypoxylicola]|uniref:Uncharacterized protein n=1 Tax=Alkalihalobacillus trypoxylicola TaxID=519424 RepID=A0A162E9H5_9BACI|nr:hypothetical protein [Alkalihalobacillus trypoxylicola]KYG32101.1 hypothetical protein AZF04_04845 [Alkalihalobacillus trypoxylicola]GAF66277.1 hypothetical protein BTS2_3177 [Bacillus sp. TS-2]